MLAQQSNLNGTTVRWLEEGTGPPVVLVHGIPTSPRLWRHVAPLINGRSLAWEMRGYGTSIPDGIGQDIGLSAQANYLLVWLDSLELEEKPILVGHDLGGGVAQIAAVRAPGRFSGLVLTNAVSYDSWPIPSVKLMKRMSRALALLPEVLLYPSIVQLIHRGHDDRQRALESLGEHWAPYVTNGAARSLMRQVESLDVADTLNVSGKLSTIGLPAHIVWGAADHFQKLQFGRRLAADLGAQLTPIPGGKHFTPEDHPTEIAAAINGLLNSKGRGRDTP
jgi:pimeloyl-ACP methyl ester carboxylesterase